MEGLDFKKIVIFFVVGVVVLLLISVGILAARSFINRSSPVTITFWGLWEPDAAYQQVFADYKKTHPTVTIKYEKQSPIQYRERLQSAMGRTGGPDLVTIHNSWMPMMQTFISPVPSTVISTNAFRSSYYPTATTDLVVGGTVYAIPLEIDTLGLYVNMDLLNAAGVTIPTNWEEFRDAAKKLTVRGSDGKIKTAGAAMGATGNIDHWQDILSIMMIQAGVDMNTAANTHAAEEALLYYTTFVSVDHVWDETLDGSTMSFAQGKVAMYFGPSWRFFDIKNINPNLNFRVIPVPQLPGANSMNYASYWAEAVSKKSAHPAETFEFLKYMASKDTMTKLYTEESKIRAFGEPYPRVDMATMLAADPNVGPFVAAAPTAKSSYLVSATGDGDTGINSRFSQYYTDAINGTGTGGGAGTALDAVAKGVQQVLASYAQAK